METLSRENIVKVYNWFELISDRGDYTESFKFFVLRNIDKLKEEVSAIRNFGDSLKPSPEYQMFDKERLELVNIYAGKNEDGSYMTVDEFDNKGNVIGNRYYLGDNEELFNTNYAKLTDKYYDVIVANDTLTNSFDELLKEEIEIGVTKITYKKLPKDINIQILHLLRPFLKETMEEIEDELLNGDE